ncbi:MAG: Hsp20/alpha crystallin family protein [Pseudanabaena sp. CRU_2_10]|nr:Hsp20/alpha crystallin family protein [Pseudanabaena sp. CRU_2_10]
MSLIRWQPWRELDILRGQMDRLFEDLIHTSSHEFSSLPKVEDAAWAPAVEMQETDSDLILKAQIPGIEAKDLDIQVSEDAVSIAGEHREEKKTEEKGYFRSEFSYGRFQRIVPLPMRINNEQIGSEFKDGVLKLTLPKVEKTAPKKVVKVDVGIAEQLREAVTQQRMQEEHLQETVQGRAAEAIGASA